MCASSALGHLEISQQIFKKNESIELHLCGMAWVWLYYISNYYNKNNICQLISSKSASLPEFIFLGILCPIIPETHIYYCLNISYTLLFSTMCENSVQTPVDDFVKKLTSVSPKILLCHRTISLWLISRIETEFLEKNSDLTFVSFAKVLTYEASIFSNYCIPFM